MKRLLVATALLAAPALAQTTAIVNGIVARGDGSQPVAGATVLIRDGRIVSAGLGVDVPAGTKVIDAAGKWVSPGLVAGFSRLGLIEVDGVESTNDATARSLFNASIDVASAINSRANPVAINRARGVTRAVVAPAAGNNLFAGQGAVIDLGQDDDAVTKPRAFQFVELGEAGARISGGSRTASHAMFRNMLAEARDYARNPIAYDGRTRDAMLQRRDAEALLPVIDGRMKLLVHAESGLDIGRTLDLKREFPKLDLVIVGATEGWTVARRIAAAGVPVIASALNDLPGQFEELAATQSNIGRMTAAGVAVAIGTINDEDPRMAFRAAQYAGNLVALGKVPGASGLDWASAFAAITSRPAEAMGLGDEIGSLRPGRRGDVVIWSGDPLELSSAPERVWIDGVEQNLTTRQTRLRDRYMKPGEGALPKAYER